MNDWWLATKIKLGIALSSTGDVLKRPWFLLLGAVTAFISLGLLVWITNLSLLWSVIAQSSLSWWDRFNFYLDGYQSLFTNFEPLPMVTILAFAVLFGINLALLFFVVQQSTKKRAADSGRSLVAIAAGAIGAGCAACGTSVLAPVLSGVGAAGSLTLASWIGWLANIIGLSLLLFSIYKLAFSASAYLAKPASQPSP